MYKQYSYFWAFGHELVLLNQLLLYPPILVINVPPGQVEKSLVHGQGFVQTYDKLWPNNASIVSKSFWFGDTFILLH